jgi:cell wall-associated NlpC family hydrolase
MTLQEQLAIKAEEWGKVGVKYQHRAWSRYGCDCTGFLLGILQELGYARTYVPRVYPPDWNAHEMASDFLAQEGKRYGKRIPISTTERGDIVLFQIGKKCLDHMGIYLGNNMFMHARIAAGKVQRGMLVNSPWSKRWKCTYRIDARKVEAIDGGK